MEMGEANESGYEANTDPASGGASGDSPGAAAHLWRRRKSGRSRMRIRVCGSMARAIVISCFCPLEIFTPSSESRVSYPSGSRSMKE